MLTQVMKPAGVGRVRAMRLAPSLIFLLILILITSYSLSVHFPRRVTPASAAGEVFSAERALAHLAIIASQPHPAGSAAQAQVQAYLAEQLAGLGLEVELQPFGAFQNVTGRLRGLDSRGAIVVLAHADSGPGGPGAADNGAGVAALLEVMRALAAGPRLRNDVIVLFDDAEEAWPFFQGARAFVQAHPWIDDVRLAINLDTAAAGAPVINEIGGAISGEEQAGTSNGRVVQALAEAYRSPWIWSSAAGGGTYDNYPFRQGGIMSLDLEDNYAFRTQHTRLDRIEGVQPGSLQQLGDQALAITRQLGNLDLALPWGEAETFFFFPWLGLVHYPLAWTLPLCIAAVMLLLAAMGLAVRQRVASAGGLGVGLAAVLGAVLLSALAASGAWALLPDLLAWRRSDWPEWPQIVPPNAGWILAGFAGLGLVIAVVAYRLGRRRSSREAMALAALIPFAVLMAGLALSEARLAFLPLWPVLIGSLAWVAALLWVGGGSPAGAPRPAHLDLPAWVTAGLFMVHLPFILIASYLMDGPNGLPLLTGLWVMLAFILLPALEAAVMCLRDAAAGLRDAAAGLRGADA